MRGLLICMAMLVGISNGWAVDCLLDPAEYTKNLEGCEIFSCSFQHPFTRQMMGKHIRGIENGKCKTEEEMPNGGLMTCRFSDFILTPRLAAWLSPSTSRFNALDK